MELLNTTSLNTWYAKNYQSKLKGLQITFEDVQPLIEGLKTKLKINQLGFSENKTPIYSVTLGKGKKKILIWSQMHGNESTGTKAIFDIFNYFIDANDFTTIKNTILNNCTLLFIPMLNPDGAKKYTRVNAKNIDLNRDAISLKAVESRLLRTVLNEFKPHFCFNLHDQRTIFNVQGTKNPATLSFLAPSINKEKTITKGRTETMAVIASINTLLQQEIPNQIGRYTDEFYPTATGDNFQKLGYNTILVEAGHFPKDYNREITRKYNFMALLQGFIYIAQTSDYTNYKGYFNIPINEKRFFDIIYRNVKHTNDKIIAIGVLYKYKIVEKGTLKRYESIEKMGDLEGYFAHKEVDLNKKSLFASFFDEN